MRRVTRLILTGLIVLYGIYALLVWAVFLFIGGALVLILPRLSWRRHLARRTLRTMFFMSAMPYRFEHFDRLPSGACVVIANHRSYLDGLVLIAALPPHFRPVIKSEIADIPIVATVLRRVGAGFVAREPPQAAGRDTLDLIEALRCGESLAVFPEGSFSPDAGLLPFRSGAFLMASKAGVPVVPALMAGTSAMLPEQNILPRPAVVSLCLLDPIRPDSDDRDAARRLRDRVQSTLSTASEPRAPERKDDGENNYAYYCEVLRDRHLPAAYIDMNLFERNIRTVLHHSGGKDLRVDARVLRCPALIERVMRSNARFHSAACATIAEAIPLAQQQDISDVLVMFPTVDPAALARVCRATADGYTILLTTDSPRHLEPLAHAAQKADVTVGVCLEMDTSVNLPSLKGPGRRTPLRNIDALLNLVTEIEDTARLEFRGLLIFDTRRSNLAERSRAALGQGRGRTDTAMGRRRRILKRREDVVEALQALGYSSAFVNCSGDAGLDVNAHDGSITEITVGPALLGLDPSVRHGIPAAGYCAEIMRQPGETLYACRGDNLFGPHITDPNFLPQPYLPPGATLDPLAGAGDGQLPIRYVGPLSIGDAVFLHPDNVADLCERFDRLLLVQDGRIIDEVETFRARDDTPIHH